MGPLFAKLLGHLTAVQAVESKLAQHIHLPRKLRARHIMSRHNGVAIDRADPVIHEDWDVGHGRWRFAVCRLLGSPEERFLVG